MVRSNSLRADVGKTYLVLRLRRNWTDRNVDLSVLVKRLEDFLITKEFEAVRGETENGYQIYIQNSPDYKFNGYATITIEGKPREFSIEAELSGKSRRDFYPVMSTTLLGGGYFLTRSLKAREEWWKFEKEFWDYVDKVIDYLSNTSK